MTLTMTECDNMDRISTNPHVSELWVQYAYEPAGDDKEMNDIPIMQCADSRTEAKKDNALYPECPWYSYVCSEGQLSGEDGPHYLKKKKRKKK